MSPLNHGIHALVAAAVMAGSAIFHISTGHLSFAILAVAACAYGSYHAAGAFHGGR